MANPEHLKVLRQGVEQWNKWRKERQGAPDNILQALLHVAPASGADLSGAYLRGSSLRGVYLRWANLIATDLQGADLAGADLGGANLIGANLCDADLSRANLRQASFRAADLREAYMPEGNLIHGEANLNTADLCATLHGANLSEANLIGADLRGADFRRASLVGADLRGADLWGAVLSDVVFNRAFLNRANLTGADLRGADFTAARTGATTFALVDLSCTKGLDNVHHDGPSNVGIDTIYKSRGKIPEVFLRGCGVPETFVTFMRSLVVSPIEFYSCFISYSSKDQEFAERLHADLQAKGVRCWFAPEDLKIGDKFQDRIEESIRYHDKLLLVLSENSIPSPWVEREVQAAFEREQKSSKLVLFPIRLDEAVMETPKAWAADIRRTRHIGEFNRWTEHDSYKKALERLLRDLKAETPAQPESRQDGKS